MKIRHFLIAVLPVLMCVSCKKHECNALSWTEYNSVEDVHCNFTYFKDEYMAHKGDTLKVYGWLFDRSLENSDSDREQILTNRKDIQFSHNSSLLFTNPYVLLNFSYMPFDSITPDNPYDDQIYITGIIDYYVDDIFDVELIPIYITKKL